MINVKLVTLFFIISLLISLVTITQATGVTVTNLNLTNTAPVGAIIVPDDYPTIQAAIGNSSAGDTIFVKRGLYYFGLGNDIVINKSLSLIGEDANATIINGRYESYNFRPGGYSAISIEASNILITGFTMTNCEYAIAINPRNFGNFSNVTISRNIFISNHVGVRDDGHAHDVNVSIHNNVVQNCRLGLYLSANHTVVSDNAILDNNGGITVNGAQSVTVSGNLIVNNSLSIGLSEVSGVSIFRNNLYGRVEYDSGLGDKVYGISFGANCNYTSVHENNISGNSRGINVENVLFIAGSPGVAIPQGIGNRVYQNNLFDNTQNANVERRYPYNVTTVVNGTTIVLWDNGSVGNHWGDYQFKYPNASEIDSSGIGDTAYVIDESNIDHYPLMQEVVITEEPSPTDSFPFLTISVIVAVILIALSVTFLIIRQKNRAKPSR